MTYVAPPHLWQLTPPTSALSAPGSASRNSSTGSIGAGGGPRGPKNAALVATLDIFLRSDATEADCLDITRWAWERAAPALGAGAGLRAGESLRGSMTAGELNVAVQREGARDAH